MSKTLVVCLHGSVPRFLRVETLSKDPLSQPLKTYSVPENTYEVIIVLSLPGVKRGIFSVSSSCKSKLVHEAMISLRSDQVN